MEQKSVWEMTLAARKDARAQMGAVQYSPWLLALSVSLAWGLLVFGTLGAYLAAGGLVAAFTGGLIAPFPVFVTAWTFAAWGVERDRLSFARALLGLPELPPADDEPDESAPEPEAPVELRPGLAVNGQIVSPTGESAPGVGMLRAKCLRFVRAGMRRGGWSRSKIAEGPNKLMSGDDWSEASRELQRLGYFTKAAEGLVPAREIDDIIRRLEAAK